MFGSLQELDLMPFLFMENKQKAEEVKHASQFESVWETAHVGVVLGMQLPTRQACGRIVLLCTLVLQEGFVRNRAKNN
jgi:hypothetical protein